MTVERWIMIGLALIGFYREAERWMRRRERVSRDQDVALATLAAANAHARELLTLKHENAQLLLLQAHDTDRIRTDERYARIQEELTRLHDKASEHRGEFQARIGNMELKVGQFIATTQQQMQEIYRRVPMVGRRTTDEGTDETREG